MSPKVNDRAPDYGRRLASAYRRGYTFERKVSAHLESEGYYVIESRGSHGCADIAAIKHGQVLLVQCKGVPVTDSASGLADGWWNQLYRAARGVGAVPLLADRPKLGVIRLRRLAAEHAAGEACWPMVEFRTDEVVTGRAHL